MGIWINQTSYSLCVKLVKHWVVQCLSQDGTELFICTEHKRA